MNINLNESELEYIKSAIATELNSFTALLKETSNPHTKRLLMVAKSDINRLRDKLNNLDKK